MRVTCRPSRSASAEQVLGRELLQAHEAEALAAEVRAGVEVLVRAAVGEQVVVALALVERRLGELGTFAAASASCTSGSARNAAARSFSSR